MEGYPPFHHQYSNIDTAAAYGSGGGDRFPHWSIQETQNFLMIRGELDPNFMETKRNKLLWELISMKMKEKGYSKSPEQCKCKWKNLVTRYKGYETMEAEGMRQQFPFYNELHAIFTARMQRMVNSKKKEVQDLLSSDEEDDYDRETTESGARKKRKIKGSANPSASGKLIIIREIMEKMMKNQLEMENKWLKAYEEKEEERRIKEMEWRQTMEDLENERIMMDSRWREREEQRRIREEIRAEKMDVLITVLLNKLTREDV
ncbi:Trihelix transcription factor GT-3b [Abeliophyllum distichum]|uniref:Trihelix transcription factor GT-3b n=1 Tax=Abeliophyllum distichum TaxID=126358 RepID=A0ABD1QU84_9LAMI